tara:strand:+ start:93 stop:512 length:420 start_codon:yes stop_codon:yes gene_type:complete
MTVTTSVLANDGGAPARIINFEANEAITAGSACEVLSTGKVQMADTANVLVAGWALVDAAANELVSLITGSGIVLYVTLDGTTDITVGDNLVLAATDNGALSKSANVDGDSPVAIALEAATDTHVANATAGALFKVLVK